MFQTKSRIGAFVILAAFSCAASLFVADAYPASESDASQDSKLGNDSKLVITHVVKTIEFEVGVLDDDSKADGYSTDNSVPEFYETDIQLLNVDLLREVVNRASEEIDDEKPALNSSIPAPEPVSSSAAAPVPSS